MYVKRVRALRTIFLPALDCYRITNTEYQNDNARRESRIPKHELCPNDVGDFHQAGGHVN